MLLRGAVAGVQCGQLGTAQGGGVALQLPQLGLQVLPLLGDLFLNAGALLRGGGRPRQRRLFVLQGIDAIEQRAVAGVDRFAFFGAGVQQFCASLVVSS